MKRPRTGSTPRQLAYATRTLNGNATSKKEAALLSGYTPAVANNAKAKIESTEGYHNAMIVLATKSNNLMLAAMHEFEARGLKDFTNKELVAALNAIGAAWERVEKQRSPNGSKAADGSNRLQGLFTRKTVTETAVIGPAPADDPASASPKKTKEAEFVEVDPDMDF
jgi:hypothetical protein